MLLFFVFLFLVITFGYSAFEKIADFKGSTAYYKSYFTDTFLAKYITPIMGFIVVIEIFTTLLLLYGIVEFYGKKGIFYGQYGLILACSTLLCFLFGQRLVKDYDGARGVAVYFIVCLFGLLLVEHRL